jgi:adenylosuccinate synthase
VSPSHNVLQSEKWRLTLPRWGDEGKGKLVDILARSSTLCCRAAGGNNAGHTIHADGVVYDFHILPSGLISPDCLNLVGSGCVVHVPSFFKEMENLREKGLKNVEERVLISERAQICFDLHVTIDGLEEKGHGGKAIGTTKKGIGPCYTDKVARRGVAAWMLFSGEEEVKNGGVGEWERRLRILEKKYRVLYGDEALAGYDLEDEVRRFKVCIALLSYLPISELRGCLGISRTAATTRYRSRAAALTLFFAELFK